MWTRSGMTDSVRVEGYRRSVVDLTMSCLVSSNCRCKTLNVSNNSILSFQFPSCFTPFSSFPHIYSTKDFKKTVLTFTAFKPTQLNVNLTVPHTSQLIPIQNGLLVTPQDVSIRLADDMPVGRGRRLVPAEVHHVVPTFGVD